MKKIALLTGILTLLLLAALLFGLADTGKASWDAILVGNAHYAAGEMEAALASYEAGLEASPEDKALRFNAAQAAYRLGEYGLAVERYAQCEDADAYLNGGNASFRLGEEAQDMAAQLGFFVEALQTYEEGIRHFPESMPLKFNYETVREKIEELQEEMEQESEGEGEGEQGEGEGENENEGEDSQSQEQADSPEGDSQGDSQNDSQEQEQESRDEDADNGQGEQEQSQEQERDEGDGAHQPGQDGQEEQRGSSAPEEGEQDQEAIARILAILENQEAENLKNNQGVVVGKGDQNGW